MMGLDVGSAILISSLVGAGTAAASSVQQSKHARKGRRQAQEQEARAQQYRTAEKRKQGEEMRAVQAEAPDPTALLEAEENAVGTMNRSRLSGPGGVDPQALRLGVNALLGE